MDTWSPGLTPGSHVLTSDVLAAVISPPEPFESFDALVQFHLTSPGDRLVVEELRAELARGPFRLPLRVEDGELVDGCHRYVAASLAEAQLPVWVVGMGAPFPWKGLPETAIIHCFDNHFGDERALSAWLDLVLPVVRSVPVGGEWVCADVVTTDPAGAWLAAWHYCHAEQAEAVRAAVARRVALVSSAPPTGGVVAALDVLQHARWRATHRSSGVTADL